MTNLLVMAAFLMYSESTYVGLRFDSSTAATPQQQVEAVINEASAQALVILEHDTVSIYDDDGSSYHAVRVLSGEHAGPLEAFRTRSNDTCHPVAHEPDIEAALRALDARSDLAGPAYLRAVFDTDAGTVRFSACRARLAEPPS